MVELAELNSRDDISYCERCNWHNIIDPNIISSDIPAILCASCYFAYCPRCKKPYHCPEKCKTKNLIKICETNKFLSNEDKINLKKELKNMREEKRKDQTTVIS